MSERAARRWSDRFLAKQDKRVQAELRAELDERRQVKRTERYEARQGLREWTSLDRLKPCGWTAVNDGGPVVRVTQNPLTGERRAGFAGLATCGSVWACPVCSEKIQATRRAELLALITAASKRGCSVLLVTLTMRHTAGDSLKELWDTLSGAWSAVQRDGTYRRRRDSFGLVGWVRAVEATIGEHGWHLHIHALVILEGQVSQERAEVFGELLWAPWHRYLSKRKGREPVRDAFDVRVGKGALEELGEYLAKQTYDGDDVDRAELAEVYRGSYEGLAAEVTLSSHKSGRGKSSRTPFEVLRDAQATGLYEDCVRWLEWEKASKGRRQLTWSEGLREWAQLEEELSDEAVADEEMGGDDVLALAPETWRAVRRHSWMILDMVENLGRDGLVAWLDARGLEWSVVRPHVRERV